MNCDEERSDGASAKRLKLKRNLKRAGLMNPVEDNNDSDDCFDENPESNNLESLLQKAKSPKI